MQDRVPTYPGRVKLTPVTGQADTYDLIRADQPTQQGTPLSKATLLSDGTEEAIWGDANDRTVDQALKELNSKNQGLAEQVEELAGQVGQIEEEVPNAGKIIFEDYYNAGDTLEKIPGEITPLSVARGYLTGGGVGSYALFAGGEDINGDPIAVADAYNAALTRSTPAELSVAREIPASASVDSYVLFAGGRDDSSSRRSDAVDAYNTALTRSTPEDLSLGRTLLAGASVGNYALFAGGVATGSAGRPTVDAYNASLTRSTPEALARERSNQAGASVGSYALFAGGQDGDSELNTVEAYNTALTRTTPTNLSGYKTDLLGASVGNYALFAGGRYAGGLNTVDAYNTALTRTTPAELSFDGGDAAASSEKYALFAGQNTVNAYNASLTRTVPEGLTYGPSTAAVVSGYALFTDRQDTDSNPVEGYYVDTTYSLDIPALSAYKFDGLQSSEEITIEGTTLTGNGKLNGYIRRSGFKISGKH